MPYGRGGAGNIQASTDPSSTILSSANAKAEESLKSSQQAAETYRDPAHDIADYETREKQQYAHMGRGGAGNYYSPRGLAEQGVFEGAGTSHVIGDGTPAPTSEADAGKKNAMADAGIGAATQRVGRGGAGNFSFGVSESEELKARKKMDEEKEKEKLRGQIEMGVDQGLAKPERAKLPGGEPY